MTAIGWRPWEEQTFARARSEGRPVLLSIVALWCGHSARMDRTTFADAGVACLVNDRFVPVRVEADRRPDVSARYALGGWPTTAFLTPDGELLGGGTYVEAHRLRHVLVRVHEAFTAGAHTRPRTAPPAVEPATSVLPAAGDLIAQVYRTFDAVHGGFGGPPKFPLASPLRLALALCREDATAHWRDAAVTTLDAMGWGALFDEQDGGFFRCARDRDWGHPSAEKLLEVNAPLLSVYVEAFEALHVARYAERAEDVVRYLQNWLADSVDGGWGGSQRVEPGGADACARHLPARSGVDRTLYADANAAMVSAALHAGQVMKDPALSEFAIRSLERVLLLCYRPGAGVAHFAQAGDTDQAADAAPVRGLLDDQVAVAVALLDAFDATGHIVYRMMAEELAFYAVRTMWDEAGGGFLDRAPHAEDIGLLRQPLKPFVSNCRAAGMLARLARACGTPALAGRARGALQAVGGRAAVEGPLAAEYLLAAGALAER